jgi:hypothetical protein
MRNPGRLRGTFATDAGMLCLWRREAFRKIRDYETWEVELCEDRDIRRHIRRGHFVPIGIGADGAFEVELRAGQSPELTDRESRYLVVSSKPYRFRSSGELHVSGLERVEGRPGRGTGRLGLPPGDYEVTVHLIGWDQEPGAKDRRGRPKPDALPDFVVLVKPRNRKTRTYRTRVDTFDRPG